MRITVMCAVPCQKMDYAPVCVDRRGGQIFHGATPGFYVKSSSEFSIGVAVSFLLEYEPEDVEVLHLEYVVGTAKMFGHVIGTTRNDFVLNPYAPLSCTTNRRRLATYENIPLYIECSCNDYGLIETSWALKVNTRSDPVEVSQTVNVRSFTLLGGEDAISSKEYDAWQKKENVRRSKEIRSYEMEEFGIAQRILRKLTALVHRRCSSEPS